jgi:hypothetical protein
MRSATRLAVFVSFLALIVFTSGRAVAQNGNGNGNPHIPKLVVDADGSHLTPLAKGYSSTAQKHRDNKRAHGNTNCQDPSSSDSPGQRRKKANDCDTEDVSVINAPDPDNCPHCGSEDVTDGSGNTVGKHLKNKVTIGYGKPSQRVDKDGNPLTSWPPLAINPNRIVPPPFQDADGNTIDPSIEDNSDNPISTKTPDPNSLSGNRGDPGSVDPKFTNVTRFHNNLSNLPLTGSDCSNFGSGKAFTAHDGNGKNLKDSKGDDITVSLPQQGFGAQNPDGTCDVSRAMVAAMNMAYGKAKGDPSKKAFDADDSGNCDTTDPVNTHSAAVKCGQELRTQHIEEDYLAHCAPNAQYVDGVCVKGNNGPQNFAGFVRPAAFKSFAAALPSSSGSLLQDNYAMMGFTLAPPEVSWGYSIDEEACLDLGFTDVCITLFAARVGYDFDLAAGLRLPVKLEVTSGDSTTPINDLTVLAGTNLSLNTSLTPADFSAQQYTDFCNTNGVADGLLVSDCNTFAFPEFFSSEINKVDSGVEVDGQELVGKWVIFAGINVVVMDITVIDIGIDSAGDLPTLGTMNAIWQNKFSVAGQTALNFITTQLSGGSIDTNAANSFLKTLKDNNLNWASFTTPFGGTVDDNTGTATGRKFPFLAGGLHLFADCTKAALNGSFLTIKGKQKPFCTGLFLEYAGATLGIGLTLIPEAESSRIDASWSSSGDGRVPGSTDPNTTADLAFTQVVNNNTAGTGSIDVTNPPIGPISMDNYDTSTDYANVSIDNFTYLLNTFGLELDANLEFGGILSPLPDLPSFPILDITFNLGDNGIPIPEHRGEKPITYPVFVQNYGASVAGAPVAATFNPLLPPAENPFDSTKPALGIKPGRGPGSFTFQLKNEGSVTGNFEHFQTVLPDVNPLFPFLAPGWTSTIAQTTTSGPAHSLAGSPFTVTVTPLKDPSTRPQVYPVSFKVDSTEAFDNNMAAVDPSGIYRLGANDVVYVNVLPYFDPRIASVPPGSIAKPSAPAQAYGETVQNHGNAPDQIRLTPAAIDFNTGGCTLTTLGSSTACPYRAVPTVIQPSWTTAAGLTTLFDPPSSTPAVGDVEVLGSRNTGFTIDVPSDWAGMSDTTYTFNITVTSLIDDGAPPASNNLNITQTVIATKESMTRYIGLEIADFLAAIQRANAAGVSTGGLAPINIHPVTMMNDDALAAILAGDQGTASKKLATEINLMSAIQKTAGKAAAPYGADFTARSTAILNDMARAQASTVTSAP